MTNTKNFFGLALLGAGFAVAGGAKAATPFDDTTWGSAANCAIDQIQFTGGVVGGDAAFVFFTNDQSADASFSYSGNILTVRISATETVQGTIDGKTLVTTYSWMERDTPQSEQCSFTNIEQ